MRIATVMVLVALALGGLAGGLAFVTDPSGASMGMDTDLLPTWLPGGYAIPGAFLAVAFGIAPAVAVVLLLRRARWGWELTGLIGLVLVAWMAAQIALIGLGFPAMQIPFLIVGVVLGDLGFLGTVRARRQAASVR